MGRLLRIGALLAVAAVVAVGAVLPKFVANVWDAARNQRVSTLAVTPISVKWEQARGSLTFSRKLNVINQGYGMGMNIDDAAMERVLDGLRAYEAIGVIPPVPGASGVTAANILYNLGMDNLNAATVQYGPAVHVETDETRYFSGMVDAQTGACLSMYAVFSNPGASQQQLRDMVALFAEQNGITDWESKLYVWSEGEAEVLSWHGVFACANEGSEDSYWMLSFSVSVGSTSISWYETSGSSYFDNLYYLLLLDEQSSDAPVDMEQVESEGQEVVLAQQHLAPYTGAGALPQMQLFTPGIALQAYRITPNGGIPRTLTEVSGPLAGEGTSGWMLVDSLTGELYQLMLYCYNPDASPEQATLLADLFSKEAGMGYSAINLWGEGFDSPTYYAEIVIGDAQYGEVYILFGVSRETISITSSLHSCYPDAGSEN